MKHKVLAIVVSLTLILSMVLPGTLAVSTAQDSATSVMTAADTTAKTEESTTATPTTATPTTGSQTEKKCNCTPVNGVHAAACPLYEVPKADEKTADTTSGTPVSTTDGTGAPTEKTCNCGATGDTHAATCPLYVAPKTEETAGAPTAQPPAGTEKTCTSDPAPAEGEAHKEGCPLYAAPELDIAKLYSRLMEMQTQEEIVLVLMELSPETIAEFTDEQAAAIEAHYDSLSTTVAVSGDTMTPGDETVVGSSEVRYLTYDFTDAAPFKDPVEGGN